MMSKPTPLGYAHVALEALWKMGGVHGQVGTQWYPVQRSEGMKADATGEIECRVTLTPGSGDAKEDAIAEQELAAADTSLRAAA